jgi:FHS family L-fucose permease-like MFS transporter
LQVAANPFVTVLGDPKTASSRLTLTQAFNSLGTTVAPTLGGLLILTAALTPGEVAELPAAGQLAYRVQEASSVQGPYLVLAAILAILAVVFAVIRLPQIRHEPEAHSEDRAQHNTSVLSHRHLVLGAIAIFLYVGGEVCIGSFMINFIGEPQITGMPAASAAHFVSYYWGGAMLGRFFGVAIMRYISPGKVLAFNASCSILLILTAILSHGHIAMWSLIAVGLCNSIMFPTIFSMALNQLGRFTGEGSGILCMAIVGGAIVPFIQGALADTIGLQLSFVVPAACYTFILYFGWKYAGMFQQQAGATGAVE